MFKSTKNLLIVCLFLSLGTSATFSTAQEDWTYATTTEDNDGIPEGYTVIEGDIIVPESFSTDGLSTQGGAIELQLWPNGIVPFLFHNNVSAANRTNMLAAMAEWERAANVDFRPWRSSDPHYLFIRGSDRNSSAVGMQPTPQFIPQVVNIRNWNNRVMTHELGHALGLWHEQSRLDRDNYIRIHFDRIDECTVGANFNFHGDMVYPRRVYGLPDEETYDFKSIMHYWDTQCSSTRQQVITVLPPNEAQQNVIGRGSELSRLDKLTMSFLYPENNWRFVDRHSSEIFRVGSFLFPSTTVQAGVSLTPNNGTLWVQPGSYSAAGTYNKPMTIRAPLGHVILR